MTNHDPAMSPDNSPNGVKRLNKIPIYAFSGIAIVLIGVFVYVGQTRGEQSEQEKKETDRRKKINLVGADDILSQAKPGLIPSSSIENKNTLEPPKKLPDMQTIQAPDGSKIEIPLTTPPLGASTVQIAVTDPEAEKIIQLKNSKFIEAIQGKTAVNTNQIGISSTGSSSISTMFSSALGRSREDGMKQLENIRTNIQNQQNNATGDSTGKFMDRMAALKNSGVLNNIPGFGSIDQTSQASVQNTQPVTPSVSNANTKGNTSDWSLKNQVDKTKPYQLRSGFIIPGVMISGINSELAGQIIGQVSENVYDTATGHQLLIPQGTRLVGNYSNQVQAGQERVLIAWNRLVFPNGDALDIGEMPGADTAGYSGFTDQVNNHYMRVYGSALLMSLVTGAVSYNQKSIGNNTQTANAKNSLSESLGQQLGQTTTQLLQKNMNISPTLEIRPGYRFNVIVVKDIELTTQYEVRNEK